MRTYPQAPARSALSTVLVSSCIERISTCPAPGERRISAVAAIPESPGRDTSITVRSGRSRFAASTAACPSPASPTTRRPFRVIRISRTPLRTIS